MEAHQKEWLHALKKLQERPEMAFLYEKSKEPYLIEQVESLSPIIEGYDPNDFLQFWESDAEQKAEILKRISVVKDKVAQPFALLIPFWVLPRRRHRLLSLWVYLPSDLSAAYSYHGISAPDGVYI